MAVGRIVVAFHQMLELAHVGVDVPVEVHADERGELQEARIDPAHRARIGEGHRRDDVLAEPHHRVAHRQIIGRGRADARVDRAAHQGDRLRLARVLVGGHQRGRRHHRHRRLADRDDMDVRPEIAAELHDVVDVVVEIEVALGERHLAGVGPVGDVHVVIGQQRLDRAAQQGGVVAAHRRHHQHLGIAPRGVAMEAQQLAERLAQQDLFVDRDGLVADLGGLQAERGLGVVLGEPRHDLGAGRHRLAEPGVGRAGCRGWCRPAPARWPRGGRAWRAGVGTHTRHKAWGADCTLSRGRVTSILRCTNRAISMT